MRIALFVGTFPLLSETFIVRQITGLLDGGHDVHIYAECGAATGATIHADVYRYNLLDRTTYTAQPIWICLPCGEGSASRARSRA